MASNKGKVQIQYAPKPAKSKSVIFDPMGQWAHPGQVTRIPGGNITMRGVNYPVLGVDDLGNSQMMYPGVNNYFFPGQYVTEYPQMQAGGPLPLIVSDKYNPSYQAYSDSLNKYNSTSEAKKYVDSRTAHEDWIYRPNHPLYDINTKQQAPSGSIVKNKPIKGYNYTSHDGNTQSPMFDYKKPTQRVFIEGSEQHTNSQKQQELKAAGLYTGPIDGIWGDKSKLAWEQYQQQKSTNPVNTTLPVTVNNSTTPNTATQNYTPTGNPEIVSWTQEWVEDPNSPAGGYWKKVPVYNEYFTQTPEYQFGGNINDMKNNKSKSVRRKQIQFIFQEGGASQQGAQDQLMQQVAQALQQGTPPEQVMQSLVQNGVPQEQAQQVIEVVMQQLQGSQQPVMQTGGITMDPNSNPMIIDTPFYSTNKDYQNTGEFYFGVQAGREPNEQQNAMIRDFSLPVHQTGVNSALYTTFQGPNTEQQKANLVNQQNTIWNRSRFAKGGPVGLPMGYHMMPNGFPMSNDAMDMDYGMPCMDCGGQTMMQGGGSTGVFVKSPTGNPYEDYTYYPDSVSNSNWVPYTRSNGTKGVVSRGEWANIQSMLPQTTNAGKNFTNNIAGRVIPTKQAGGAGNVMNRPSKGYARPEYVVPTNRPDIYNTPTDRQQDSINTYNDLKERKDLNIQIDLNDPNQSGMSDATNKAYDAYINYQASMGLPLISAAEFQEGWNGANYVPAKIAPLVIKQNGGNWIQGAVKHPGRCTPGSPNFDCPKGSPQYNLMQTFRKMAKKQFGGTSAPQNSSTDSMVDQRKNTMQNFLAQNTTMSLANQEADDLAETIMQMGGSSFGYNPNMYNQNMFNQMPQAQNNVRDAFGNLFNASMDLGNTANPYNQMRFKKMGGMYKMQPGGTSSFDDPNNSVWDNAWDPYNNVYTNIDENAIRAQREYGDAILAQQDARDYWAETDMQYAKEQEAKNKDTPVVVNPSNASTARTVTNSNIPNERRIMDECETLGTQAEIDACIKSRLGSQSSTSVATPITTAGTRTGNYAGDVNTPAADQAQGQYVTQADGTVRYVPGGAQNYNLFPANFNPYLKVRGRGPMWGNQTFPALAYNPANTFLDKDIQKSNIFGNKRKMVFSHGYPTTDVNGNPVNNGQLNPPGYNGANQPQGFDNYLQQNTDPALYQKWLTGNMTPEEQTSFAQQEATLKNQFNNSPLRQLGPVGSTLKRPMNPLFQNLQNKVQNFQQNRQERGNRRDLRKNPIGRGVNPNFANPPMQGGGNFNAFNVNQALQDYDPYADSYGKKSKIVMKDKMGIDPESGVAWGLAGAGALSSLAEMNDAHRKQEQMRKLMNADALFQPNQWGDTSRGDYETNTGMFRPDDNVPVQFQGNNFGQIGSGISYKKGGEYYLDDVEIAMILKRGGTVKYLD